LAVTAAGFAKPLWRRLKRNRAQNWSSAPGKIEFVDARQPKVLFFFAPSKDSSANHLAELKYSYSMAGNSFTGRYEREFPTEWEAWDFLRDLQGKSVTVLVNPLNPSSSTLSESAVETLLQTRPQISEDELVAANSASSSTLWFAPFLPIFVALSAVGFALSLWVHIASMMGRLPQGPFFLLHLGVFVVWFPAIFVARQKVGNLQRKDFWKRVLTGAPDWMRYFVYALFFYTFVSFALSMTHTPAGGRLNPSTWKQFSGAWMDFYAAAFTILYAASKEGFSGGRCINGHVVLPGASFCTQCGKSTRRSF
jgi:hypothetical protein